MEATLAEASSTAAENGNASYDQDIDKQFLAGRRLSYGQQQQQALDNLVDALDQIYGTSYDISHGLGRWAGNSSSGMDACSGGCHVSATNNHRIYVLLTAAACNCTVCH
jgi:hypothetical protein